MNQPATKIVIISGAGISAESGLATFRDPDGLWQQYDLEDLATPQAFDIVFKYYEINKNTHKACRLSAYNHNACFSFRNIDWLSTIKNLSATKETSKLYNHD